MNTVITWAMAAAAPLVSNSTNQEESERTNTLIGLTALGAITALGTLYYLYSKRTDNPMIINIEIEQSIAFLREEGLLTPRIQEAILTGRGENATYICMILVQLHRAGILTPENLDAVLAFNKETLWGLSWAIERLQSGRILTQENVDALLLGDDDHPGQIASSLCHEHEITQKKFDKANNTINSKKIAKTLGQWNGGLPGNKPELRIPPELIGDIATLSTSPARKNEHWEAMKNLAEEEERNSFDAVKLQVISDIWY